ncbi:MAG: flagellar biosynthetic protein FliP [Gammaproteobacteria bacterium]|nr:MAG: flagellar biosynthetic protein FliP [Gammaproteobacteria bacterium]
MNIIDCFKSSALIKILVLLSFGFCASTYAAGVELPGVDINFNEGEIASEEVSTAIKVLVVLTVLSLAPAILMMVTSFTRIIVVLSMLRHAFGMQETPPNSVLISLALFLTIFTMAPVINDVNEQAFQPYLNGELTEQQATDALFVPVRAFMAKQTREKDIALMIELSGSEKPKSFADVTNAQLIPAFMLSELKSAFEIGFVIFLPFLLIDIVVASILMSMGMLMVPPMMISMPIKILMFVLIDGWYLVVRSLVGSFGAIF